MSEVRTDTGPFAMVPEWLLFSPGVSAQAVRLFAVLHRHEGIAGCHPSRKRLCMLMNVSEATLDRAMEELVKAQAIDKMPRRGADGDWTSNEYRLHFVTPRGVTRASTRVLARDATGGVTGDEQTKALMNESTLNETPPSVVAPRRKVRPLTAEQFAQICAEFGHLGNVEERIAEALDHKAAKARTDMYLYVRSWLRRDNERRPGNGTTVGGPGRPRNIIETVAASRAQG